MDESLTVLTVFWKGEFRGRQYNEDWVRKVKRMVRRYFPHSDFRCLSNTSIQDVGVIPLRHDYPGWWSKIELFRPDLPVSGRLLYIDLDCLIVNDPSPIMNYPRTPAFMPPSYQIHGDNPSGGVDICDRYQSSIITWHQGEATEFYTSFTSDIIERFRGDQDWFSYVSPNYFTMPPEWFCKLKHCPNGPQKNVKIVLCMPYKNNEAAKRYNWVSRIWNR